MEKEALISRIEKYTAIWEEIENFAPGGYDALLEDDDFWDPFLHCEYKSRRGWHKLGSA